MLVGDATHCCLPSVLLKEALYLFFFFPPMGCLVVGEVGSLNISDVKIQLDHPLCTTCILPAHAVPARSPGVLFLAAVEDH